MKKRHCECPKARKRILITYIDGSPDPNDCDK